MSQCMQTSFKDWEEEILPMAPFREQRGIELGEQKGQIQGLRLSLRVVLETRFGPLPALEAQRIQAPENQAQFEKGIAQPDLVRSLAEMPW